MQHNHSMMEKHLREGVSKLSYNSSTVIPPAPSRCEVTVPYCPIVSSLAHEGFETSPFKRKDGRRGLEPPRPGEVALRHQAGVPRYGCYQGVTRVLPNQHGRRDDSDNNNNKSSSSSSRAVKNQSDWTHGETVFPLGSTPTIRSREQT